MSKGISGRFAPQRGKLSLGIQLALLTCCGVTPVLPAMATTDPSATARSQAGQYHQFDVKGGRWKTPFCNWRARLAPSST
ncbi:hypothetical protein MXM82_25840 [Pseudomonas asiatica]|uniref:hypothetical protein n=1 Tax=Pseudomonas asiatica TaxID=2219225 RepID=UPI002DBC1C31|nr:hypothetical protein [Pseudomonas asiatica]MEB6592521.1 hypothetical protein [Pseudomonas asiatica]